MSLYCANLIKLKYKWIPNYLPVSRLLDRLNYAEQLKDFSIKNYEFYLTYQVFQ